MAATTLRIAVEWRYGPSKEGEEGETARTTNAT
jgi:hypothetical protein